MAPVPILFVDDSPAERELAIEAARECPEVSLTVTASIAEAMAALARAPQLRLALVDLNLGRESGRALVQTLRGVLPAIILTTTDAALERQRSLDAGALDFWVKPLRFEEYPVLLTRAALLVRAGLLVRDAPRTPPT